MTEESERKLTGYCGLYCGDCIRYHSKASDLARQLIEELNNTQFEKYAKIKSSSKKQFDAIKRFEHYKKCYAVLEAVAKLQCNSPCRIGEGCAAFSCNILECCRQKGFEGFWQCEIFENCEKFTTLKSVHGDTPQQNLIEIKKHGIDNWAKHRHKAYVWQK